MRWTNVRPIPAEREAEALRIYFALEACFNAPAWTAYDGDSDDRQVITIQCQRCNQSHMYRSYLTSARRKFCDVCCRTQRTPKQRI